MASSKQTPINTRVPQPAKIACEVHSDSGYDSGVEIKTKTHGQKVPAKNTTAKKLVSNRSWHLSDKFTWYKGSKDRTDSSLEDPYDQFHHSGRSLPRAPNAPDQIGNSLDKGRVESDFYIKGHPERRNPLADIYQIQADYEESIVWQPVEKAKPATDLNFKESEVIQEEDEPTNSRTDFNAFKKNKRRNKMKDMSRERNSGF